MTNHPFNLFKSTKFIFKNLKTFQNKLEHSQHHKAHLTTQITLQKFSTRTPSRVPRKLNYPLNWLTTIDFHPEPSMQKTKNILINLFIYEASP